MIDAPVAKKNTESSTLMNASEVGGGVSLEGKSGSSSTVSPTSRIVLSFATILQNDSGLET